MTSLERIHELQKSSYYYIDIQFNRNNLNYMQTRYETLLDQLHINKRELGQYRQKYINIQNQLVATQQQNRTIKKNLSNLQDQCNRLTQINKNMQLQKQQLMSGYSTSIDSIKDQINKKQHEIYNLKQISFSPQMNQKLIQKQIRCEVQNEFNNQLENKDERIKQLQLANDRLTYQKQLEQQKHTLKVQSLQKQLRQLQNSHLIQLQNYANKTYQNSQSKVLYQEQSIIKKLKKQIDELRARLDNSQHELSENINQKNRIQKQHSSYVMKNRQQIDKLLQELRVHKAQTLRLQQLVDRNRQDRDNWVLRDKQKQIRKLKTDIQQLHEQIQKKQRKQSQKQIQISNLKNQIKTLKQTSTLSENQIIRELKSQKQSLKREIIDMRHSSQVLKNQFNQLQKTSINQIQNIYKNNTNTKITQKQTNIKKLTINTQVIDKSFQDQFNKLNGSFGYQSPKNIKNQSLQNQKKYYQEKLEKEQRKIKEIAQKYVDLKKKYNHLEQKFKQANQKVVQLLKTKIQLGSPTNASRKTFQFPHSPHLKMMYSPKNTNPTSQPYDGVHHSKTEGNLGRNLMRQQLEQNIQRSDSKQLSFYQRSLNLKNNQKLGQLRCINHDNSKERSLKCSHSKSPIK